MMAKILVAEPLLKKSWSYFRKCAVDDLRAEAYSKGKPSKSTAMRIAYIGRIAEIAAAQYFGLDPLTELNWSGKPDAGYDFMLRSATFDVKASDHRGATRLMWPVTKRDKMHLMADCLIWAYVAPQSEHMTGRYVHLVGWISGEDFRRYHHVASGLPRVVDGTPFVHEKELQPIHHLHAAMFKRKDISHEKTA